MKYLKIILIYLFAISVFHFNAQGKNAKQQPKIENSKTATKEVSLSPTSNSKASRMPASTSQKVQIISPRVKNFVLKKGSSICPNQFAFIERRDCGGFELTNMDQGFQDLYCFINKGPQTKTETLSNGLQVKSKTQTQKKNNMYSKVIQINATNPKLGIPQTKMTSHVRILKNGIQLYYSSNGESKSCHYKI
ncbi:MAG: hypothetical protein ACLGGX_11940 [Bdellovibrionia bacterium]